MTAEDGQNINPVHVTVWWTPLCGALHTETDPAQITLECPDGTPPDWQK